MEWNVAGYIQDTARRQETSNTEVQGGNKKAADKKAADYSGL